MHDHTAGVWMIYDEASTALGVSERTLRRRVARGELAARTTTDGRREIFVADDARPDSPSASGPEVVNASERALAVVGSSVALAERVAADATERAELAGRRERAAWRTVAALLAVAAVAGTVGGVYAGRLSSSLEAAETTAADLAGQVADRDAERVRLAAELDSARRDLLAATTERDTTGRLADDLVQRVADLQAALDELAARPVGMTTWPGLVDAQPVSDTPDQ